MSLVDALTALTALTPDAKLLAVAVLFFQAGAACPTYYAQERFRGFGRALVDRLPYRPPPGMEEAEALQEAASSPRESRDDEP